MHDLAYTIYQSTALIRASSKEHNKILKACQKHNPDNEITGFLHREQGFFLQYLEGPPDALDATMFRISIDFRHNNLQVLDTGTLDRRRFPDWQMGFVNGGQLSLCDLIDVGPDRLNLKAEDPFDLVVFMTANADSLRHDISELAIL